ncbi:zf-TFIIB domain-containing protein [Micromonospora deserti]|uniref:Transcription factor zinc-finger domain-containing protein n=1 Tax=Micromonospora deserti TaxID=2070366 RepID=A0A2W2BRK1_9ACTN|nr:zf-TFIIB domain-containing protein [Micromonospora deserti]PZF89911.1 hypothetical protein C1I99_25055 [Micromonospora deserti]
MMSLTCPKCHGEMRQYERSGVVIDQCSECRGIFLDRGELEKLFEAEANWNRQQGVPAAQPVQQQGSYPGQPGQQQGGYPPAPAYGQHHGYHGHYRRKKHKSFLDEMFG